MLHHYSIIDRSRINELDPMSLSIVEKYNGELIGANPVKTLIGTRSHTSMVINRFDHSEEIIEFYHSSQMTELAKFKDQVIEGFATVISGHSETVSVAKSNILPPTLQQRKHFKVVDIARPNVKYLAVTSEQTNHQKIY